MSQPDNPQQPASGAAIETVSRPWVRPLLLGVGIAALLVTARALGLGERFGELRAWIQTLGSLGPFVYAVVYAVAVVAAVPGSLLTIAAGAMFGSVVGVIVVSIGSTVGAAAAFAAARWIARDAVSAWVAKSDRLAKLDRMTEEHGAIIVAITRLVPIFPFTWLNYGFGLTRVPFRTYVFWSWLCMLPGTVLYVVGTDAVLRGVAEGRVPWPLVGVLAAVSGLIFLVVRRARRAISSSEAKLEEENAT